MSNDPIPGLMSVSAAESRSSSVKPWQLRKYLKYLAELILLVLAYLMISSYQARKLLDADRRSAPALQSIEVQGGSFDLQNVVGKSVLVYFFAPWCAYCAASADNIVRLRRWRDEDQLSIVMVALDWQSADVISEYVARHRLNVPVLLGDATIARDWNVYGFPTYYVLDRQHRIVSRDIGYSTQLGLLWRSWVTD